MKSTSRAMLALAFASSFALCGPAHAGIPEVLRAAQAVEQAKAEYKTAKASLTKREKAELAVAEAQAKLNKLDGK